MLGPVCIYTEIPITKYPKDAVLQKVDYALQQSFNPDAVDIHLHPVEQVINRRLIVGVVLQITLVQGFFV